MDLSSQTLTGVLEQADYRVRAGSHAASRVWPTGFDILDQNLSGGLRGGELVLLGGPQGLGKTTWVMQAARNAARSGRSAVIFSFEHDLQTLLIRLVALEAGHLGGADGAEDQPDPAGLRGQRRPHRLARGPAARHRRRRARRSRSSRSTPTG